MIRKLREWDDRTHASVLALWLFGVVGTVLMALTGPG